MKLLSEEVFQDFVSAIFEQNILEEDRVILFQYYLGVAKDFELAMKEISQGKEPPLLFKCRD
jgi:hypothetical protein